MAERQTRRTQNPVPATGCGFKSHRRHPFKPTVALEVGFPASSKTNGMSCLRWPFPFVTTPRTSSWQLTAMSSLEKARVDGGGKFGQISRAWKKGPFETPHPGSSTARAQASFSCSLTKSLPVTKGRAFSIHPPRWFLADL